MPNLKLDRITGMIMRAGEGRIQRTLQRLADQTASVEEDFRALSDAELRALTDEYKERHAQGETLDALLPETFATVREAARRTLGMRHFDVQIMGGAALHLGNVAEMQTGEGKTLVATLPAYLNALTGEGVHLVTVNDYLAERDAQWMGPVYRSLGLSVGVIKAEMPPADRRVQYACDITYGTNTEFGFDYLRDNMAWSVDELVQRGHNFAVVDEADSILVDEARTPLVISGPADQPEKWYGVFAGMVAHMRGVVIQDEMFTTPAEKEQLAELRERYDYEYDPKKRTVALLARGMDHIEDQLGIDNLFDAAPDPLLGYINNAFKAKDLFKKDKDYVLVDGEVMIVDEHTGRILSGRRYNDGVHQAIEAKEGVEIKNENQTLAKITLQNYFRLYNRISGMTGTAMTEAAEFHQIYKLHVVPIATNRPLARKNQPDAIYREPDGKFQAVVRDIVERHRSGQPVLVGTVSVEKSELLSGLLAGHKVPHQVLNAKHHQREAQIVAQAGRRGAVTVATNMAGRGIDIMLGGNAEAMAEAELREQGLSEETDTEACREVRERIAAEVAVEHEEVKELGGLYVLGTERHESRRIDNQLRGRSGRQGDPGESRFYLSLGDDLMLLFRARMVERLMEVAKVPDDQPIENKMVTRAIAGAQAQVEQQNFEARKNLLKYDDVLNHQRELVYGERRRILHGEDVQEQLQHFMDDTVDAYVAAETAEGFAEEWDLARLWSAFRQLYPVRISVGELAEAEGGISALTPELLADAVREDIHERYAEREAQLGGTAMRELERRVLIVVLDRKWREHLYEMDYLQESVGLRFTLGRDPLIEYRREGFDMFDAMMDGIKEETVGFVFNLDVEVGGAPQDAPPGDAQERPEIRAKGLEPQGRQENWRFSAPTMDTADGVVEGEFPAPQEEPEDEPQDDAVRAGSAGAGQPPSGTARRGGGSGRRPKSGGKNTGRRRRKR